MPVNNLINGTRPVPPPTSKSFPSLILNELPYGPLMPIGSPTLTLYNAVDASPYFLIVKAAFPFSSDTITLIGSSLTPGIQTIANWPGRTLDKTSSEKVSVLTVGVSSTTFSILQIVG